MSILNPFYTNLPAANRSSNREQNPSPQGSRNHGTDLAPLAEQIWWAEAGSSQTTGGTGEGKQAELSLEKQVARMWGRETSKP
jgi:hypothetical protein